MKYLKDMRHAVHHGMLKAEELRRIKGEGPSPIDPCGDPFPESAVTSLPSMMDEYLYTRSMPDAPGAGRTEMAYVPNETLHNVS